MRFFLPDTASWDDAVWFDTEDYATPSPHARIYEVSIADLPDEIRELEGACE